MTSLQQIEKRVAELQDNPNKLRNPFSAKIDDKNIGPTYLAVPAFNYNTLLSIILDQAKALEFYANKNNYEIETKSPGYRQSKFNDMRWAGEDWIDNEGESAREALKQTAERLDAWKAECDLLLADRTEKYSIAIDKGAMQLNYKIKQLTNALEVAKAALKYMTEEYDCDAEDVAAFDKRKAEQALEQIEKIEKGELK